MIFEDFPEWKIFSLALALQIDLQDRKSFGVVAAHCVGPLSVASSAHRNRATRRE